MSEITLPKPRLSTYLCGNCGREFSDRDERNAHFDTTGHGLRRFSQAHPVTERTVPFQAAVEAPAHRWSEDDEENEHYARQAETVKSEPIEGQDEAIAYAKTYDGDFEFMVSMKAKCLRPAPRLSEKMVAGILRCKARDASPAGPANVRQNKFAGPCGNCRNEVPAEAGRIEKVNGRWTAYHLDGTCPAKAAESDGEGRKSTTPPTATPDVEAGRYAVETEEGHLAFYRVDRPTEGRWAGYTFLKVQASDELHPIKGAAAKAILTKIAVDPKGAMLRYGLELGHCGHCGRTLTDETSRAAGIGPVCRENLGW